MSAFDHVMGRVNPCSAFSIEPQSTVDQPERYPGLSAFDELIRQCRVAVEIFLQQTGREDDIKFANEEIARLEGYKAKVREQFPALYPSEVEPEPEPRHGIADFKVVCDQMTLPEPTGPMGEYSFESLGDVIARTDLVLLKAPLDSNGLVLTGAVFPRSTGGIRKV